MFTLKTMRTDGDGGEQTASATIEVHGDDGQIADVFVEVYKGVPRLVVCFEMDKGKGDDVKFIMDLRNGEMLPT